MLMPAKSHCHHGRLDLRVQEVPAVNRQFQALTQTEMQMSLKCWLQRAHQQPEADGQGLDSWISGNLADSDRRRQYVATLVAHSQPLSYPKAEELETLGDMHSESVE